MLRPSSVMGLLCTVVANPGQNTPAWVSGASRLLEETLLHFRCHTANVTGSPTGQLGQVRGNTHG